MRFLRGSKARTSSPLKIIRDENLESSVKGLYPCGEGAGYAGGITSAAMDGLKVQKRSSAGTARHKQEKDMRLVTENPGIGEMKHEKDSKRRTEK